MRSINVVCCFDTNFISQAGAMLMSLIKNNKDVFVNIYAIVDFKDISKKEIFIRTFTSDSSSIHFYELSDEHIKYIEALPIAKGSHITKATYFRLLIPKILPKELAKVIYIDSDIIVQDSLYDLYTEDIDKYALAACKELKGADINIKRLEYPSEYNYFCAGFMLINLNYWRENNITEQSFDFLSKYPGRILWWDQDALNACLYNKWKTLHPRYNCDPTMYYYKGWSQYQDEDIKLWLEAVKNPAIIHYLTAVKPWHILCNHPKKDLYFYYLDQTPWAKTKIQRPSLMKQLRIIMRFLILGKLPNVEGF